MADKTHVAAAEILIGALLNDPDKHLGVVQKELSDPMVWPARFDKALNTIAALQQQGDPITAEIVSHHSGLDVDRLLAWQASTKGITPAEVDANIPVVLARGKLGGLRRIGRTLGSVNGDKPPDVMLDEAAAEISRLQRLAVGGDTQTPAARVSSLEAELEKPVKGGVQTGLTLLDSVTWNWRPGAATLIASPYKQRKSTALRNIALAAAARGHGVSIAMCEDGKSDWDAACVAMIANALLLGGHIPGASFSDGAIKLSGDALRYTRGWRDNAGQYRAVKRAFEIYKALPIYVTDMRDHGGDPFAIRSQWRRDVQNHGVRLVAVDYIQIMAWSGQSHADRAQQSEVWLRATMGELQTAHGIAVAQLNEEGVKGGSGYSPGIRGGGALAAGGHTILATQYDGENAADTLTVRVKLARAATRGQQAAYTIEPSSGVVTSDRQGKVTLIPDSVLRGSEQAALLTTPKPSPRPQPAITTLTGRSGQVDIGGGILLPDTEKKTA
jgi:replicative DNA helicase